MCASFVEAQGHEDPFVWPVLFQMESQDLIAHPARGHGSGGAGDVLHGWVPRHDEAVRGDHEDPVRGVADHVGEVAPLLHRLVEQTLVLGADLQLGGERLDQ